MTRSSKTWNKFTAVAAILVLIFIAGLVEVLAQTTQDNVVDKNQSSNSTTNENGFLGSGMSLLEISLFWGGYRRVLGRSAAVALIRRRQLSIQVIIATSEDISKFLRDKQSDEFSRIEKVVKNVERNPKASFVDKTIAYSYRLQADKRINEALQKWRDLVK